MINLRPIPHDIPQQSITEISLKVTPVKFILNLPEANEWKSATRYTSGMHNGNITSVPRKHVLIGYV